MVMTTGAKVQLKTAFEDDPAVLRDAIDALAPSDEAGTPHEAVDLALTLLKDRERGRVVLVTDRAFDGRPIGAAGNVELVSVGKPVPNVAITRFDVQIGRAHV